MANKKVEMAIPFLSQEMMEEILSRLPAERVLEIRAFCKKWQDLTCLPEFIDLHLLRQDLQEDSSSEVGFIVNPYNYDYSFYYGAYVGIDDTTSYESLRRIKHPNFQSNNGSVGSCRGLICVFDNHNDSQSFKDLVYIFNPITRECINLPKSTEIPIEGEIVSGFGYNHETNDYKVVRVCYDFDEEHAEEDDEEFDDEPILGEVEVYTLGSGRGWRNIGQTEFKFRQRRGVLADGALHWIADPANIIVSFDMAEEKFIVCPSPPCLGGDYQMQVLRGLLHVIGESDDGIIKVWSLNKTKEKEKIWIYEFKIEGNIFGYRYLDACYTFSLTNNGNLLFWFLNTRLCLYDPRTATIKDIAQYDGIGNYIEATAHTNSFVSLKALGEVSSKIELVEGESESVEGQGIRNRLVSIIDEL